MRHSDWQHAGFLVLVAAVAAMSFLPVVDGGGFVFDDHVLLERNRDLDQPDIWWRLWQRDYYASSEHVGDSGYYRPVAVLCNVLDAKVWQRRASGAHWSNIALHAATSVVAIPALSALGVSFGAACVTALLFAAHPVHAESVAFISGRVDVLATLFLLLVMAFAASRRRGAWLAAGIAALLAFLSKEHAIVLPALLFLVTWARPGKPQRSRMWFAIAAAAVLAFVLRYAALDSILPTTAGQARSRDMWLPFRSMAFMLASTYAPVKRLAVEPAAAALPLWRTFIGLGVATVLWTAAARVGATNRATLLRVGVAAFVGLLPVANLLRQETQISERFAYLSSVFLLVPVGILGERAWQRRGAARWLGTAAMVLATVACVGLSNWRAEFWRTDLGVWGQAVREEPLRGAFWDRYGLALTERRRFAEAESALRRAVALAPRNPNGLVNLGVLLRATGRVREAVAQFDAALRLQPQSVATLLYRGQALLALGEPVPAYESLATAARLKPDHPQVQRLAGQAALQLGDRERARQHFAAALRLLPGDPGLKRVLERLDAAPPPSPPAPDGRLETP